MKGGRNVELARKFIDWMLSKQFQEDIPLQMFVFPVNASAKLPEVFILHAQIPQLPAQIDFAEIAEKRDGWVAALRGVLLP